MNNKEEITKSKLNKDDISTISGGIVAPTMISRSMGNVQYGAIKYFYYLSACLPNDSTYHRHRSVGVYDTFDKAMERAYDIEKDATERNSVTSEDLDKFLSELPK